MDSPDIFEAVIYIRWPYRTPSGFAVGWVYVEIERRSSYELVSIIVLTICNQKKLIAPPAAVGKKKGKKSNILPFFPTAAVRGIFRMFFERNIFEKTFELRVSIGIGLRHGNWFVLEVRKCPVYSRIRSKTIERTIFENCLPPPYLLGFRLHSRVTRSTRVLDTENELDDEVRQTSPLNGDWSTDWLCFDLLTFAPLIFVEIREKTRFFRLYSYLSV